MSGLADYGRRRRRSFRWRALQLMVMVLLVLGGAGYSYRVGQSAGAARSEKLEADLERFQGDNLDLRDQLTLAARRTSHAERELALLQQRLVRELPRGAAAELLQGLERQLEAGIGPERLAFMIEAAGQAPSCEGTPETKRFVVQTPLSQSPALAVRLAERVIVTGAGEPARDEQGRAEAWFDPAAPVHLDLRTLGGEVVTISGILPLRHSMVLDGQELRIAAIAGERSFVEVTAQVCALPDAAQASELHSG